MIPENLIRFTGATEPDYAELTNRAQMSLDAAEGLCDAYTRGRHKRLSGAYKPGVEAVILTVAARILANPEQISVREQIGPYQYYRGPGFSGFTLVELAVLNRYRKRAV